MSGKGIAHYSTERRYLYMLREAYNGSSTSLSTYSYCKKISKRGPGEKQQLESLHLCYLVYKCPACMGAGTANVHKDKEVINSIVGTLENSESAK